MIGTNILDLEPGFEINLSQKTKQQIN